MPTDPTKSPIAQAFSAASELQKQMDLARSAGDIYSTLGMLGAGTANHQAWEMGMASREFRDSATHHALPPDQLGLIGWKQNQLAKMLAEGRYNPLAALGGQGSAFELATAKLDAHSKLFGQLDQVMELIGKVDIHSTAIPHHIVPPGVMDMIRQTSVHEKALRAAGIGASMALPKSLEAFRIPTDIFADRLALGRVIGSMGQDRWNDRDFLLAFGGASAMADALSAGTLMTSGIREQISSLALAGIPGTIGLGEYRSLLDASGLVLPRWPVHRPITPEGLPRRRRRSLSMYEQPEHVAEAKSLVHRHESYLRAVIDDLMCEQYGEDWPKTIFPTCIGDGDSKSHVNRLIKKWETHGGRLLDHADYVHYAIIMAHPDHFAAVFKRGFDDPDTIRDLIGKARLLRAASHHPGPGFLPLDLQELRVVWRALRLGLDALIA